MIHQLQATRYVAPLREGGSLPAIVDTEPPGQYVVKFRGAGQGPKALVAEIICAGIAERLALPVPISAVVFLSAGFGRGEPDPEIQDVLRGSVGPNFGLAYVPEALGFDVSVDLANVPPDLASAVVWFDALVTNPDRTARNSNILVRREQIWLIDHGAALYFHHRWDNWEHKARSEFPLVRDHILLRRASELAAADRHLARQLDPAAVEQIVANVPDAWLEPDDQFRTIAARRQAYATYLSERLREPRAWVAKAIDAHQIA